MKTPIESVAHFCQTGDKNTISISPSNADELLDAGETWDSVKDGLQVLLVDQNGFSNGSFVIRRPSTDEHYKLDAEVEFIGEGIVMAKLKGYID